MKEPNLPATEMLPRKMNVLFRMVVSVPNISKMSRTFLSIFNIVIKIINTLACCLARRLLQNRFQSLLAKFEFGVNIKEHCKN